MFNAKQHRIDELQATVDVYGEALQRHHDSMGSCEDVRGERDALRTRVAELEKRLKAAAHVAYKVPGAES